MLLRIRDYFSVKSAVFRAQRKKYFSQSESRYFYVLAIISSICVSFTLLYRSGCSVLYGANPPKKNIKKNKYNIGHGDWICDGDS